MSTTQKMFRMNVIDLTLSYAICVLFTLELNPLNWKNPFAILSVWAAIMFLRMLKPRLMIQPTNTHNTHE